MEYSLWFCTTNCYLHTEATRVCPPTQLHRTQASEATDHHYTLCVCVCVCSSMDASFKSFEITHVHGYDYNII